MELDVAARSVLLDALIATAPFRRSLIIVGAQAIYLRTSETRLALAPFTSDADIAIDPSLLPTTPALDKTLMAAGFWRSEQPGTWRKAIRMDDRLVDVDVDLLVPEAVAPGSGTRSVTLEGHDRMAARRVPGLEAALVDHGPMRIASIDPTDTRSIQVEVAGEAALFIAKIHKIGDRVKSGRHQRVAVDKDAADIFRLIQATPVRKMAAGFRVALSNSISRGVALSALKTADELFGRRGATGIQMAVRAISVAGEAPETIAAAFTGYSLALAAEVSR